MWRADYSLESPLLPKSPRCRWAACLISPDYSLIGVLQNTMTSALFTDGINHSLAELEIPTEFIPSTLFEGCIAQPPAPHHPASVLVGCWVAEWLFLCSFCASGVWRPGWTSALSLSPLLDFQGRPNYWSASANSESKRVDLFHMCSCEGAVGKAITHDKMIRDDCSAFNILLYSMKTHNFGTDMNFILLHKRDWPRDAYVLWVQQNL